MRLGKIPSRYISWVGNLLKIINSARLGVTSLIFQRSLSIISVIINRKYIAQCDFHVLVLLNVNYILIMCVKSVFFNLSALIMRWKLHHRQYLAVWANTAVMWITFCASLKNTLDRKIPNLVRFRPTEILSKWHVIINEARRAYWKLRVCCRPIQNAKYAMTFCLPTNNASFESNCAFYLRIKFKIA